MTVLKNGTLIDGIGGPPVDNAYTVIDGGIILSVNEKDYISESDDSIIDCEGTWILPGFINCHTHIVWNSGMDIPSYLKNSTRSSQIANARMNIFTALKSGQTTIRDLGGPLEPILETRNYTSKVRGLECSIYTAGEPITSPKGHMWQIGIEVEKEKDMIRTVHKLIDRGVDLIKICASGAGMTPGSSPLEVQFDSQSICAAVNAAHSRGKKVAAHAMNCESIKQCVEAGVDTIEHCVWYTPDGTINFDRGLAEEIANRNIYVCPTVSTGAKAYNDYSINMPLSQRKTLIQLMKKRKDYLRKMNELGVKFIAGNDAGYTLVKFDEFTLEIEMLMEEVGISFHEAIVAATKNGARALGIEDFTGTIETGKRADIVIFNKAPVKDILSLNSIFLVLSGGKRIS